MFKIIKNGNVDTKAFKALVPKMKWFKENRKYGTDEQVFYLGVYENSDYKVRVKIRPSLTTSITESFLNVTEQGSKPEKDYKGPLVNYGTSLEFKITSQFLKGMLKKVTITKREANPLVLKRF